MDEKYAEVKDVIPKMIAFDANKRIDLQALKESIILSKGSQEVFILNIISFLILLILYNQDL